MRVLPRRGQNLILSGIKDVPPSAGCVIQPVGRLLHARSNVWWISYFRRDLANNVTSLIVGFALEECRLQIHVKYIPALICGCLDCKAEATPGCSRTVCLLIVLLLVLEAPEDPASLGL